MTELVMVDIQKHKRHRGDDKKISRDWSGLPNNVIATILDKLPLCESLSFSNVCKPWRSFQKQTSMMDYRNPLRGFPWLVMSKETGSEPKRCFSVLEKKLWKMKMPKADGGLIWGSFEDWLVIAKSPSDKLLFSIRISLLNPFSGAEVVLPEADTRYHKLVFSGDPNKETCVYMAFSYVSKGFFAWIPGAKDWLDSCLGKDDDVLLDLISFDGSFYFLTKGYNIRVVDAAYAYSTVKSIDFDHYSNDDPMIDTQLYEVKMSPDIQIESDLNVQLVHYLVEFRGEILLVIKFMKNQLIDTYDFKVLRLDFDQMEWVELDNLGDFCIFLGRNCTRCYSNKELGVYEGNCIYFTNESGPLSLVAWDHKLSCSVIDDWGIFRLNSGDDNDDGNSGSESFSYHANEDRRTPVWLTAPVSWYLDECRP